MPGVSVPHSFVSHLPTRYFSPGSFKEPSEETDPSEQSKDMDEPCALVVDDVPDVSEMFGMMLRLSGYHVTIASSATEALEHASVTQFDVIVSDIGMPVMNGYELARRLRSMPGYSDTPMIAVTGFARYDDRERALQSGFNAHLTKPVSPDKLIDLIESLREQAG